MKVQLINKSILIAIGLLTFAACKPKKQIIAPPVVKTTQLDSGVNLTAETFIGPTLKDWTYFSAKINIKFTQNGSTTPVEAHLRMYKDSLIWISAGYGLYRILINNDSMVIMDKINTSYTVYDKASLAELMDAPLTVSQIQNILLGQPAFALKFYQITFAKDSSFQIDYIQEKFVTSHAFNKQVMTIDSTRIDDNLTTNYANAIYSSYSVIDSHNLPYTVKLFATSKNPISMEIEYSEPDFTTALTFPFTIPASYDKKK